MTQHEHPDFGKAARFSEHTIGDHITYPSTETGQPTTGEIVWIQEDQTYVVAPDAPGFVDSVKPSEVLVASSN